MTEQQSRTVPDNKADGPSEEKEAEDRSSSSEKASEGNNATSERPSSQGRPVQSGRPRGAAHPRAAKAFEHCRYELGAAVYGSMGITVTDTARHAVAVMRNFDFFGAPLAGIVSMHRDLARPMP